MQDEGIFHNLTDRDTVAEGLERTGTIRLLYAIICGIPMYMFAYLLYK